MQEFLKNGTKKKETHQLVPEVEEAVDIDLEDILS